MCCVMMKEADTEKFMRQLILVRHAKSDRSDWSLSDVERPLAPRGVRDAPDMAQRLAGLQDGLDAIYSSVARRAMETAEYFAQTFDIAASDLHLRHDLYTFSPYDLVQALGELDDAFTRIAVFGHNPAISGASSYLGDTDLGDLPTCAVVRLQVDTKSWKTLAPRACTLLEVDTPKRSAG